MTLLIEDLSKLTTIPIRSLDALFNKSEWIICNAVEDAKLQHEGIAKIDVGFGVLLIKIDDENVKYKFIPSTTLEANITKTINSGKNPLLSQIEDKLAAKIENTYKDLL